MSSGNGNVGAALVLGFGAGLYFFFKGFRVYRKYRVLADTPVMPIRSIAMGLVEVHGKARGDQCVLSPVSHTPCLFYKVDIERWQANSKGRGHWAHFKTDADGAAFYLQDATGKVLVDAHGAELDLLRNSRRQVGEVVPGGFGALFSGFRKADAGADWVTDSEVLDYVTKATSGVASLLPEPNWVSPGDMPTAQRELRRHRAPPVTQQGVDFFKQILFGGLAPRVRWSSYSGRYRLSEYCILPDHWYDVTGTCTENPHPQDADDRNLIVKGENEPTFLISWRSEKEIEGALRRRAILCILGGAALSVVCLAFILGKLGWF